MLTAPFTEPIAQEVWQSRYRLTGHGQANEPDVFATWDRVALALSDQEAHQRDRWRKAFRGLLAHFRFLPGGRILAGAGAGHRMTLFNCFTAGNLHDSLGGIFEALAEAMITMQAGGGIGCDFSPLRPRGMEAAGSGNIASGPVSFLRIWNEACSVLTSMAPRSGAMMALLRCDHPDIETFIDAKREGADLHHFNLSVLISDAFIRAVEEDAPWRLVFPIGDRPQPEDAAICDRQWSGADKPERCLVMRTVMARELWQRLQRAAFACGDPGVVFMDRIRSEDNLRYAETISAVNPCGEVPLPPHGACNLGSINLTQFIDDAFGAHPRLKLHEIASSAALATRLLDNVIDASPFPLKAQQRCAHGCRRIGIGITGLADAFAMLGIRYGSAASLEVADTVMKTICEAAYLASTELAAERGSFPLYRSADYLAGPFIQRLPAELGDAIRARGMRNSHLLAIAPAGTISLLANNVSSGMEPVYALDGERSPRNARGETIRMPVRDHAWRLFRERHGEQAKAPDYFVEARDLSPVVQLEMQATLQPHVDQSISKTVNLPTDARFDDCSDLFLRAWRLGLKGCTMFRSRPEQPLAQGRCACP
ncbi:adenosylcobalamin-dependent ribonucleoside-diphosphate reductase [Noviherbaspirillum pedocola]|uniref:Vitamin B12-dependent ribonucleotide reductase n=1 Tax=Noviherbaspirillum pedocola TaxID=2801341 RepID=A0A934T247_9BURK|nr:adenosylcobalamin-dependent ribonucleoside-diphosphate reductase [Noviherbaspirillum pedocola]MBK4737594.1 adenosylcobalamin-dependent ribonucleoside-diphosphate reductase [Noviherbaspirillum pedocola]